MARPVRVGALGCAEVAFGIVQHRMVDVNAMAHQFGGQAGLAGAQHLARLLVGVLGQMTALPITEGVGQIQLRVAVVRLNQDDVGIRIEPLVLLHAQLHAGVDHGAECLAQHRRQTTIDDAWYLALLLAQGPLHDFGNLRRGGVKRDQRIQA